VMAKTVIIDGKLTQKGRLCHCRHWHWHCYKSETSKKLFFVRFEHSVRFFGTMKHLLPLRVDDLLHICGRFFK
jgi:hypothetical protein